MQWKLLGLLSAKGGKTNMAPAPKGNKNAQKPDLERKVAIIQIRTSIAIKRLLEGKAEGENKSLSQFILDKCTS